MGRGRARLSRRRPGIHNWIGNFEIGRKFLGGPGISITALDFNGTIVTARETSSVSRHRAPQPQRAVATEARER